MLKAIVLALLLGFAVLHAPQARAASLCAAQPDDDTLRPLPAALVPRAEAAFELHNLSPAQVEHMTVMRCMGGKPYGCFIGANLPCGKANTASTLPAAKEWCTENPEADFVPAYISGHDSIYKWRCRNGAPAAEDSPAPLDARGYFKAYWKAL